jgi:alanyl-tRNA synthetase
VGRTGQIGAVVAVAEKSVGAGLRRVEFLAGERAESYQRDLQTAAEAAARVLRVGAPELADRVAALVEERKKLQKEIDDLRRRSVGDIAPGAGAVRRGVAFQRLDAADPDLLRSAADNLLDRQPEARVAVVIGGVGEDGRVVLKTRKGGLSAADAFARVRAVGGGKGGGNATLAQGGGFRVDEFDSIVTAMGDLVEAGENGSG